jgi:peptidoglycan hydrolase-like protein with peptidoglycan-binding domain
MSAEWPLAKQGKKGVAVRALQRLLLHRGADIDVDGSFGPATVKAVKEFQSANGIDADGAVGTKTWSKLVVPVKRGQSGEPVLAVQELVGIAADGKFGPDTEKAIRRFQKRVHLAVDGVVGPHTWQLLIVESQGQG